MTLPTEWIFPPNEDRLKSGDPAKIGEYVQDLSASLTTMYQNLSQNVNGDLRQFAPRIFGQTVAGQGTYGAQDGWYLRKGLMVDFWFAMSWSAHTGSGAAYILLPYKVKKTIYAPFIGTLHGTYNYAAGYTNMFTLAASDSFQNVLYADGPGGLPVLSLQLLTSGTLFGHIRYIGQEIEN